MVSQSSVSETQLAVWGDAGLVAAPEVALPGSPFVAELCEGAIDPRATELELRGFPVQERAR